jgi:hypothetical protein
MRILLGWRCRRLIPQGCLLPLMFERSCLPNLWANLEMAILSLDTHIMASMVEQIRRIDTVLAEAISRSLDNFEYDFILSLIADK